MLFRCTTRTFQPTAPTTEINRSMIRPQSKAPLRFFLLVATVALLSRLVVVDSLSLVDFRTASSHLFASPPTHTVRSLANLKIPGQDIVNGEPQTILAYCAKHPKPQKEGEKKPVLILLHEFFGLSKSICDKADALAQDLDIIVVAPDTFRGVSSTFIPKCIWLALSTPQKRVNQDLDAVVEWLSSTDKKDDSTNNGTHADTSNMAVMGLCYGGGKAIRYTAECQPNAATVVCYGSPLTDTKALSALQKPVCGVFGSKDAQFSLALVNQFRNSLQEAKVENSDIRVYENVGHAFWSDMDQVRRGDQP